MRNEYVDDLYDYVISDLVMSCTRHCVLRFKIVSIICVFAELGYVKHRVSAVGLFGLRSRSFSVHSFIHQLSMPLATRIPSTFDIFECPCHRQSCRTCHPPAVLQLFLQKPPLIGFQGFRSRFSPVFVPGT